MRIIQAILLVTAIANAQVNISSTPSLELANRFDNVQSIQNPYYSSQQPDPRYNPELSLFISKSILDFAHDLSSELLKEPYVKAQIFSPTCLASSLSLLLMGSHGETFNQINKLLKFDRSVELKYKPYKAHEELGFLLEDLKKDQIDPSRPRKQSAWRFTRREDVRSSHALGNTPNDHIINIANALFVQNGYNLRYEYESVAKSVYRSEVTPLDFRGNSRGSKEYINSWAKEKTLGKISQIVTDDIDPSTNVILASTLYFKGFWENSFISAATTDALFYPDGRNAPGIKIKMMANGGIFPYYEDPTLDCRILGFPYKGNLTTMYIILPNESNRNKVRNLLNILTAEKIDDMISQMTKKTAVLTFPKLHISSTLHMKSLLTKMGIKDIFDSRKADLSLISDGLIRNQFQPLSTSSVPQEINHFSTNQQIFASPGPSREHSNSHGNTPINSMFYPTQSLQVTENYDKYITKPNNIIQPTISTAAYHKEHSLLGNPYQPQPESVQKDDPLIFTRFSEDSTTQETSLNRTKRAVKYKVESQFKQNSQPLRLKDLILRKRITKTNPGKKVTRNRRQVPQESIGLQRLESLRSQINLVNPGLFADDILHKVDLVINEQGTEAAAATITYLRRSGTDVTFRTDSPFILLIRHDPTRLPLFYGAVYEPVE